MILAQMGRVGQPLGRDRGGISPEPWHLSYAPLARTFQDAHTRELLERALLGVDLELKDDVLRQLQAIYARYVKGVSAPPPTLDHNRLRSSEPTG
jgi:hypothetical protein